MSRLKPKKPVPEPQERWIIDAVEDTPTGQVARLELPGGQTTDVPLRDLPPGVKEGDILSVQSGPDGLKAEIMPEETQQVRAQAQSKIEALNKAGEVTAGQEITL